MFKEIFKEMFHPSKAAIISSLKRSDGLPVSEVAKEVDMSYMGVKQHCINLEKMGFLESWRVPRKEVGRPEKLYRLTAKCDELFPTAGADVSIEILDGATEAFGEDAPEKLLRNYFQKKQDAWSKQIPTSATLEEKVKAVSELREADGFFNVLTVEDDKSINIREYHNPLTRITEKYPILSELEHAMLEQLTGTQIKRAITEGPHGQQLTHYGIKSVA